MDRWDLIYTFADRHPVAATIVTLVALILVVLALAIMWLAQYPKMSKEDARANPRFFAAVVLSKKLGPVLVGIAKPAAGLIFGAAASALVEEHFSTPRSKP